MDKGKARKILNICIAVIVFASWLLMAFGGEGDLSENGIGNLKFYTVLSNIMEGIASAVWLASRGPDGRKTAGAERFKYISAAAVMLTFATVAFFLGPLYGYSSMFKGANLFFHLLIPLAAAAEIIFLTDFDYSARDNAIAVLPVLIYGIFYIANILINGRGEWPDTNDWYWFLAWGYPVGILIFAVLCLATWLLALMLRKAQKAVRSRCV